MKDTKAPIFNHVRNFYEIFWLQLPQSTYYFSRIVYMGENLMCAGIKPRTMKDIEIIFIVLLTII